VASKIHKGCLVRWIIDYKFYAASDRSEGVTPQEPIYNYGIVLEVSKVDPNAVVVMCYGDGTWIVLNMIHDEFEILSEGIQNG
jgi:hypothetical protein